MCYDRDCRVEYKGIDNCMSINYIACLLRLFI